MKKIRKIEKEEIGRAKEHISKLSQSEKDRLLASLFLTSDRIADILKYIVTEIEDLSQKEKGEIKDEIEQAISIGPKWLNYSYKLKKKKH